MPTERCAFYLDGELIDEQTGSGPNDAVARRAAISKFDWEDHHDGIHVRCR